MNMSGPAIHMANHQSILIDFQADHLNTHLSKVISNAALELIVCNLCVYD